MLRTLFDIVVGSQETEIEVGAEIVELAWSRSDLQVMDLDYDFEFLTIAPMMRAVLQQLVCPFPDRATMKGGGRFEVRVRASPSQ